MARGIVTGSAEAIAVEIVSVVARVVVGFVGIIPVVEIIFASGFVVGIIPVVVGCRIFNTARSLGGSLFEVGTLFPVAHGILVVDDEAIISVGDAEAISPVGSAVGIIPVVFRDDETLVPVARGIIVFEVYPAIISVFDDKVGMIPVVVSETAPIVASAEDVVCDDEIPVVGSTIVSESDVGPASISDDEVREPAIVSEDRVAIVGYAIISEDGVHEAAIVSDDGSTDRGSAIDFKISCS